MGDLKERERLALTTRQSEGMVALVALAVLLYVGNLLIFPGKPSASLLTPFGERGKGTFAIALTMDGQEQGVFFVPPAGRISDLMLGLGLTVPRDSDGARGSRRLLAGDKIYLSSISPESPVVGKMSAAQSLALDLPIDINQASLEELILVPGIGERTAARINAFRSAKKKIRSLAELMELRGIKEKRFDKLKKYFFVQDSDGHLLPAR